MHMTVSPWTDCGGRWSVVVTSSPVPRYSHHAVLIGTTVLLVTIAVITMVVLVLLWGRRGR